MYEVIIDKRAELEYTDALNYCDFIGNKSIIKKFNSDFSQILNTLKSNPFFELKLNQFRTIPFDNFPFLVFFKVYEDIQLVKILSIFHTSLDPRDYP